MSGRDPTILFVGRVVPNKCQEDLVKLLYHLRLHQSNAHLVLVGDLREQGYVRWLEHFIHRYGMAGAVTLAGHVSQQEMVTYYKSADLFVSMSEHEGFGKPLIESMYFGLPVMAYSAAAVPSTMGGAGILFSRKEFEPLAEMVHILHNDQQLRQRVVETQLRRVQAFLEPAVKEQFRNYLAQLELLK
jgi:glycosyltransferase involved in cell wall biosynthesis